MFKKIVTTSIVFAISSSLSFGAAPYIGGSIGINNTTSGTNNFRGVPLTIAGGYQGIIKETIYLAGEIFGTVATATLDNNRTTTNVRTTYGYGVSVIPGMMISDHTLAFLRLGVLKSRFSSPAKSATGGQLGLGLQTSVTQNWELRGEYNYTKYQHFSGISPKTDLFNLGLIYNFQ